MHNKLSATQSLLVVVLVLGIVAILVAYVGLGPLPALLVSAFLCVLLWMTKALWIPPGFGATRVRLASLSLAIAAIASYGVWGPFLDAFANAWLHSPPLVARFPWIAQVQVSSEPSLAAVAAIVAVVFIVNYFLADRTISGQQLTPVERWFPEKDYPVRLVDFCVKLRRHLDLIDRDTNWSPDYYTALEADVEIYGLRSAVRSARVTDLVSALRDDKQSRAFLVLGDPGAGKSVALRKLTLDMLAEVSATNGVRVPIYLNLREWLPAAGGHAGKQWTEENRPTLRELTDFVVRSVKASVDLFAGEFVDQYFMKMWDDGRLFFVVDSFDEIPQLLDVQEDSWLIAELSTLLWQLIAGHGTSRGVLASRFFRRPSGAFEASKILDIRPFSEEKIAAALSRYPKFTQHLQKELFLRRPDLMPIARNPFLMTLLAGWVNDHEALPESHAVIYESHLRRRLERSAERMRTYGLTTDLVLQATTELAWFIYESGQYGLEAPAALIAQQSFCAPPLAIMDVLAYGRIARQSSGEQPTFAFVHRRFLEYFVAQKLVDEPHCVRLDDVPTDSKSRDALVLFAQLADFPTARRLAEYCWSEVRAHFGREETRLRAIHCLRFLSDAYRSQRLALEPFAAELAQFIRDGVSEQNSLLVAKHSLEATGLLDEELIDPILKDAIRQDNDWLQETAFRACRHIPRLSGDLEASLHNYVWTLPLPYLWKHRRQLLFSLSLSDGLAGVRDLARARLRDICMSVPGMALGALVYPTMIPMTMVLGAFATYVDSDLIGGNKWFGGRRTMIDNIMIGGRIIGMTLPVLLLMLWLFKLWWPSLFMVMDQYLASTGYSFLRGSKGLLGAPWPVSDAILAPLLTLGGLLVVPWVALRTHRPRLGPALLLGLVGMAVLLGILFVMSRYIHILWQLLVWVGVIGGVAAVVRILYLGAKDAKQLRLEWNLLRTLPISARLSRTQIAAMLQRLRHPYLRRKFVQTLADRRVVATGKWPDDFSLAARDDAAITQLARLEEGWLGLDR